MTRICHELGESIFVSNSRKDRRERPPSILTDTFELHIFKTSVPIYMPTAVPPPSLVPLPEELLQYLSPYRVVVCTSCRYAIQPKAIARHLKEIHGIKRSDRQPFMRHVEKFELAEHELVKQYIPGEFPVSLLPVQNGLQCRSKDCGYLCVTEKRMKNHWLSVHRRQGLATCDWQTAPLQTFFKGNLLRYFTGTSSGTPAERIKPQIANQNRAEEWKVHNQNNFQQASLIRIAGTASSQPLLQSSLHNLVKNSQ